MTSALIFSILLLLTTIYGLLSTFLNSKSSKKPWRKEETFSLFDKILGIVLFIIAVIFFVFVLIKYY